MKGLVAGFLEDVSSEVFHHYLNEITSLIGKQHGVYALYKRNKLYYVGLATDLRNRVKYHLKDRHAHRWDSFSLYLIANAEHIRELETLVVHIAVPKGNIQAGSFRRSHNLKRELRQLMKQRSKSEQEKILSLKPSGKNGKKAGKAGVRKKRLVAAGKPSLAGLLTAGTILRVTYKKTEYTATVDTDGRIRFGDKTFNSPSLAGWAVKGGKATNGWTFWKYERPDGKWILIDELRKKH